MKIGELASATATKVETVRYYEKIGLLPPPARTSANYRAYGTEHLARLSFIRRARDLGFTLGPQASPVVAVRIEDRETALRWWPQLLEQGIYVNLVVPPASPSAFSLLRCSVSAAHSDDQVDRIIAAFATLRTGA